MTIGDLIKKYNQDATASNIASSTDLINLFAVNEAEMNRLISDKSELGRKISGINKKTKTLSIISIALILVASVSLFFSMFTGLVVVVFAAGIFITSVNTSKEIVGINSQIKIISEKVINLTNENAKIKTKQGKVYRTYDISSISESITRGVLDMEVLRDEEVILDDILTSGKANGEAIVYAFVRKDLSGLRDLSLYLKLGDEEKLPNINKANEALRLFSEDATTYFTGTWGLYNDNGKPLDVSAIIAGSKVESSPLEHNPDDAFEINKAA